MNLNMEHDENTYEKRYSFNKKEKKNDPKKCKIELLPSRYVIIIFIFLADLLGVLFPQRNRLDSIIASLSSNFLLLPLPAQ